MKIVINRSDALGDLLLTLPIVPIILSKYPEAKISLIVSNRNYEVVKNNPLFENILVINTKNRFHDNLKIIYEFFKINQFSHYFYVGGSWIPSFVARFLKVEFRGGLIAKWHGFIFLNKGLRQKRSMVEMHESKYNLELLRTLDISLLKSDIIQNNLLILSDDEKRFSLRSLNTNHKYIVVHPGMTGHTLNWPASSYVKLILDIEKSYPNRYAFVISYTPSDEEYITKFRDELDRIVNKDDNFRDRIIFFDGSKLGLRNYSGIIAQASLFIGPSTGPTHLANFLGVKQVGIYSPIRVQSIKRWGPIFNSHNNCKVIAPNVECPQQFDCAGSSCRYYECMSKIEVDMVLKFVKELLA